MTISELYKSVRDICGHDEHISVSVEVDRYSGRNESEVKFCIYDSQIEATSHTFDSTSPELALRKYELELARIKYAVDDLDYEVKNV